MSNELSKQLKSSAPTEWDAKRISGIVVGVILFGAIAAGLTWFIWTILLPLLVGIVSSLVLIIIGTVLATVAFYYFTQPSTWLAFRILGESLAEKTLGHFIEMDRLGVMQMAINSAKKDREQLRLAGENLRKQDNKISAVVQEKNEIMHQKQEQIKTLQNRLAKNPEDEFAQDNMEIVTNDFTNAKMVIDVMQPQLNDIKNLVKFTDKAYRKSGVAITNQQNKLDTLKQILEASTSSSNAMAAAMKAFKGDPQIGRANDMAIASIRDEIYANMGAIQSSLKITSQIMNQQDLEDAGKVAVAAKMASSFDDKQFDYAATVSASTTDESRQITSGNPYLSSVAIPETVKIENK